MADEYRVNIEVNGQPMGDWDSVSNTKTAYEEPTGILDEIRQAMQWAMMDLGLTVSVREIKSMRESSRRVTMLGLMVEVSDLEIRDDRHIDIRRITDVEIIHETPRPPIRVIEHPVIKIPSKHAPKTPKRPTSRDTSASTLINNMLYNAQSVNAVRDNNCLRCEEGVCTKHKGGDWSL